MAKAGLVCDPFSVILKILILPDTYYKKDGQFCKRNMLRFVTLHLGQHEA